MNRASFSNPGDNINQISTSNPNQLTSTNSSVESISEEDAAKLQTLRKYDTSFKSVSTESPSLTQPGQAPALSPKSNLSQDEIKQGQILLGAILNNSNVSKEAKITLEQTLKTPFGLSWLAKNSNMSHAEDVSTLEALVELAQAKEAFGYLQTVFCADQLFKVLFEANIHSIENHLFCNLESESSFRSIMVTRMLEHYLGVGGINNRAMKALENWECLKDVKKIFEKGGFTPPIIDRIKSGNKDVLKQLREWGSVGSPGTELEFAL